MDQFREIGRPLERPSQHALPRRQPPDAFIEITKRNPVAAPGLEYRSGVDRLGRVPYSNAPAHVAKASAVARSVERSRAIHLRPRNISQRSRGDVECMHSSRGR